jgi:hypothetical protein
MGTILTIDLLQNKISSILAQLYLNLSCEVKIRIRMDTYHDKY